MNNVNEDAITDLDAAIAIVMSKSGAITVEEAAEALMKSGGNVDSAIELIVLVNETTFKTTFKRSVESHNNAKSVPEYIDDDTCRQEKKSVDDDDDDKKVATNQKNAGGAHNGTNNNTMNTIAMETPTFANQRQRNHHDSDDTCMSETGTLSTDSSYTTANTIDSIPLRPRPPRHQTSQPGAFRVADTDGGSNENEEEYSVSNTTTTTTTPPPQSDPLVLAEVVNEDEENQRIREQIDREVEERERERMEREGEIPEAEIVDMIEKNQHCSSTGVKIWCGIAVIVLTMVTVAIILGTVLVPRAIMMDRASDDPPTSSPSRQEVLQELESLLSLVSFDDGTALQTPLMPQNMALNWLANNTNLDTYSDAKKIQRFALATLFYSTNGTTWYVNDTWMSNHEDECGWYNNGASLCTRGSIDRLNLEMNNLVGKIPNELALLSNLSESSVV
jgi:hypothetical protein